jgi:Cu-Zn family superoxide dismutase
MHPVRLSLAAVIALAGCAMYGSSAVERADVPIRDAAGRDLGTLTLAPHMGGLMLTGRMVNLPPGTHGIHLHETGRCEPPFESAGAHWNPTSRRHGTQNPEGPHLGDMPNLVVASDGSVAVSVMTAGGTLSGDGALMDGDGAAVVVHAAADDYRTDPSGNSGGRIACGVVRATR